MTKEEKRKYTTKIVLRTIGVIALLGYCLLFLYVNYNTERKGITSTHDWTYQGIEIVPHVYPSKAEVNEAYKVWVSSQGYNYDHQERVGWATWSDDNYCEVHFPRIKNENDKETLEIIGHEIAHCFYGNWHKEVSK
ncbi:MAG: hypothetical protein CL489_08790 [Acidobacteria bacterium]|nr:hypothetical protein [Acidobacteriota bacterium]|tara:strand:- start:8955 stop:9362 length:408 start_codon:yes stop_codon:yes gene_type:complete